MNPLATRISQAFALLWMCSVAYATAIAEISLGVSLAALLAAVVRGEIQPWSGLGLWAKRALVLWGAFAGWIVLSHFFAVDRANAIGDLHKMFRFAAILPFACFPWDRRFRFALYAVLTGLAVALAVEALPPYLRQRVGRVEAASLHYNTLAQYGAAISLLLSVAALGETRAGPRWRIVWGLGAMLGVAILVCTLSRMAWAAWFSAVPVIGLLAVPRRRRWILVVASVAVIATAFAVPHLQQRLQRFTEFDDPEFVRRYDMWNIGEQIVSDSPLFGAGPSGVSVRYDELKGGMLVDDERRWVHLHNDPINIAAHHGLPAAFIWVLIGLAAYAALARWIFLTPRAERPPPLAVGAALSIHVFFMCGMLHDTLPIYRKFAWYLLLWGLLIHASSRKALEEPES